MASARVQRIEAPGWIDPERVFAHGFADAPYAIWLDGGTDAAHGMSVIAAADASSVLLTADAVAGTRTRSRPLAPGDAPTTFPGSVFDAAEFRDAPLDAAAAPLGWIGWFGYEAGAERLGVDFAPAETPDAALLFVDRALVFDHAAGRVAACWLEGDADAAGADAGTAALAREPAREWARRVLAEAEAAAGIPVPAPAAPEAARAEWRFDAGEYEALIGRCQAAITAGDAYQLCLTNRIDVAVRPDPASAYLALRAGSPSHHGGYLRFGEHALLSASPEQFLAIDRDRVAVTKPMKGTRPRSADPARDRGLARELLESEKERAENLMIVDLMRNDLGRVARLGTVRVPELLAVEEYAHVHQLVSTVTAELADGVDPIDAVASCFPAGSMTGAPKLSAMATLHALERGPRGVYSGAFGYLSVDGSVDLAMVIRSIVLTPRGASIGTGGGITALSVPAEEVEETRVKARALLAVLGAPLVQ